MLIRIEDRLKKYCLLVELEFFVMHNAMHNKPMRGYATGWIIGCPIILCAFYDFNSAT